MKARTRLKLIVLLAVTMAAALIGGCSIGLPGYDETLENYNLTAVVTYYGNGGYFDSSTSILYRIVGSEEGSAFYNIQSSDTSTTVTRGTGWTFVGWYYIETVQIENEDGESEDYFVCEDDTVAANFTLTEDEEERVVVVSHNGSLVISRSDYDMLIRYATLSSDLPLLKLTDEVDTSMKLSAGEIYIAAKWVVAQGVNYQLVMCDGGTEIAYTYSSTDSEGNTTQIDYEVKVGETIYTNYFGTSSTLSVLQSSPVTTSSNSNTMTDGTWLEFYFDEACTEPIPSTYSFAKPESGDLTVYALYTTGLWTVVKEASDVKTIFNNTSGSYYFFVEDGSKTIDCTDVTVNAMSVFSGTINGNGCTVANLTVTTKDSISTGYTAMFGTLRNGATIKDITFDNLTATYTTKEALSGNSYTPYIYFFTCGVQTGAVITISNVNIINSTMDITVASGVTVMNIQTTTNTDNWLYSTGYGTDRSATETDNDFVAVYGGFELSNVKLVYNETQIAEINAN